MATFVITAESVTLGGQDVTAFVRSASLELSGANVSFTSMASAGAEEFRLGLKTGTLNIELNSDYAVGAGNPDQLLWGLWNTGANVAFVVRPTSAAVSTSNPNYSGSVTPTGYTAVGGAVGDASTVSISWPTSGAISRATA